ncbi:MAG: hypothetical protein U0531_01765 [Dehalococcoidia bacterium]
MPQILIVYTTLRGNTGKMVEPVAAGIRAEGVDARVLPVEAVTMADLLAAGRHRDRFAHPVRRGGLEDQASIRRGGDRGVPRPAGGQGGRRLHGRQPRQQRAELTLLNALHILLNHGMIVQGEPFGIHYGQAGVARADGRRAALLPYLGARWAGW